MTAPHASNADSVRMCDPALEDQDRVQLRVASLWRYPVKSMLGEVVTAMFVDRHGADGDRRLALIDAVTGRVASAKQPRLWRELLHFGARLNDGKVCIEAPDGTTVRAEQPDVDELLSRLLGRSVQLVSQRSHGATLERPDPELVLAFGLDAEVESQLIEVAQATPGESFTDLAPLHAITTATVEQVGTEAVRYRPNLVIATPPGYPPYAENAWVGKELAVGEARLRVLKPTSRCAVPTLEHGRLPLAPHALRALMTENRLATKGSGMVPCAGVYLEVLAAGTIHVDDPVILH